MLDYLPEIKSDFAVFHPSEGDPWRLGSPRFFQLAPYLEGYDGAVRYARLRDDLAREREQSSALDDLVDPVVSSSPPSQEALPDITSIVAMTRNNQGLPSISYTTGG